MLQAKQKMPVTTIPTCGVFVRSPRPFVAARHLKQAKIAKRSHVLVRAEDGKATEKKDKLVENFKKGGLDKETAKRVLQVWEESGAKDSEGLKKLLVRRSLTSALTIVIQTVLDAGAAYGAYSLSGFLQISEGIPLNGILSFLAGVLGSYFAVGVLFDLFTLGVVGASSLQFQTDSQAFLSAVKEMAGGEETGLNVIDKAQQARNTLKVLKALNDMSDLLKTEASKAGGGASTLSDLSTYLLLTKAEKEYGFSSEKEGLSVDEAGNIARLFARIDTNGDDRLDLSEVRRLVQELQPELSEDETKEAFKILDTDSSRSIEFPEFVRWYKGNIKSDTTVTAE